MTVVIDCMLTLERPTNTIDGGTLTRTDALNQVSMFTGTCCLSGRRLYFVQFFSEQATEVGKLLKRSRLFTPLCWKVENVIVLQNFECVLKHVFFCKDKAVWLRSRLGHAKSSSNGVKFDETTAKCCSSDHTCEVPRFSFGAFDAFYKCWQFKACAHYFVCMLFRYKLYEFNVTTVMGIFYWILLLICCFIYRNFFSLDHPVCRYLPTIPAFLFAICSVATMFCTCFLVKDQVCGIDVDMCVLRSDSCNVFCVLNFGKLEFWPRPLNVLQCCEGIVQTADAFS